MGGGGGGGGGGLLKQCGRRPTGRTALTKIVVVYDSLPSYSVLYIYGQFVPRVDPLGVLLSEQHLKFSVLDTNVC